MYTLQESDRKGSSFQEGQTVVSLHYSGTKVVGDPGFASVCMLGRRLYPNRTGRQRRTPILLFS